ncbi:MAG: hypothetical protein FVQ81_16085 [Candidatus Glassbacteria bacterium]|nr:hypothetical protein [Candidatus Glassbacteria bacterium]
MKRELISKEDLQVLLTAEIRKHEGCEECGPLGIVPLQQPDATGCNWTNSDYIPATEVSQATIQQVVAAVVAAAQSKYNIIL